MYCVGMPWDYFVELVEARGVAPGNTNPLISKLLAVCPDSHLYGLGGKSVVLWISPQIVAKVSLEAGDERTRCEQEMFVLLDPLECPQLVQCLFRGTDVTFLEFIDNQTLRHRMNVIGPKPIWRWMLELSSAAACLETLGYAHGDIDPRNILVDTHDQLHLIDYDNAIRAGDRVDVGYEPYVRQFRRFSHGQFGVAGPQSEQFALGSVFYYISRGSEMYSELEGHVQVNLMLDGIFPATDPYDPIEKIIDNCWNNRYSRVADLVKEIKARSGLELQPEPTISSSERRECKELCEKYYNQVMNSPS
ncbi:putative Rho-associated protein kinase [Xylariomycetidae sp. FL2044]|nr:putative Rho-associated protein kinase [Xylariomycetidae sp. FL2044]